MSGVLPVVGSCSGVDVGRQCREIVGRRWMRRRQGLQGGRRTGRKGAEAGTGVGTAATAGGAGGVAVGGGSDEGPSVSGSGALGPVSLDGRMMIGLSSPTRRTPDGPVAASRAVAGVVAEEALEVERGRSGVDALGGILDPKALVMGAALGVAVFAAGITPMGVLGALVRAYAFASQAHPLLHSMSVCAALFSLSDLIAQAADRRAKGGKTGRTLAMDHARLSRMAAYAFFIDAPLSHAWYMGLEAMHPGKGLPQVLSKAALSQCVWEPIIVTVFLLSMALMKDGRLLDARSWMTKLRRTVVSSWRVWPALQVINMALMPPQHRVAFCSVCNLCWVTYLSLVANTEAHDAGKGEPEPVGAAL